MFPVGGLSALEVDLRDLEDEMELLVVVVVVVVVSSFAILGFVSGVSRLGFRNFSSLSETQNAVGLQILISLVLYKRILTDIRGVAK